MSGSPLKLFQRRPSGWRSLDPICSKFFIRCASQPVRELSKVIIEESLKVLNCDRISLFVFDKRIEMSLGDISTIRIGRPPSSTFWKRKNRPVYTLLGVFPSKIQIPVHIPYTSYLYFPNSHAMWSCKTNRRTGAVGSPSELVGGWCQGHILMTSRSCCDGVPVMF